MFKQPGMPQFVPPEVRKVEDFARGLADRLERQGLGILDLLQERVEKADLPGRFKRDVRPEELLDRITRRGFVPSAMTVKGIQREGEAGMKRAQLLADILRMRQNLGCLASDLQRLVMDIEMALMEEDCEAPRGILAKCRREVLRVLRGLIG